MLELDGEPQSTMAKTMVKALPADGPVSKRWRPPTIEFGWLTRGETVIAATAIAAAVAAVWLTLRADFLAHPGWLAVQKADIILGPVFTGLYWRRRRPGSRFGLVLIAVGLLSAPYLLQSSAEPWAFSFGVIWEGVIYVATMALILAFPTGRLDGLVVRLMLAAGVVATGFLAVIAMVAPVIGPDGSISGCLVACPENAFFVSADVPLALRLIDVNRVIVIVNAVVAIALIVHRFAAGTPPRARALAIGAPIAVVFLVTQVAYQSSKLFDLDAGAFHTAAQWAIAATRASLWYGFLLSLIAAELFAGRVLRRLVLESLRRPSLRELETMLRVPLGDPDLRLAFRRRGDWVDGDGVPTGPSRGQVMTAVERDGRPAAAIVHDAQLAEHPELIHAAGAVALLAQENVELEHAWTDSLGQLSDSRARIATAGDIERQAIERDLHDGAQQQLTAVLVKLALVGELLPDGSVAQVQLAGLESELEETLTELRRLAHGIHPVPLAQSGIAGALQAVATRSADTVEIVDDGVGRYAAEVEAAVYYCCLEALQNATKHAGHRASIVIRLSEAEAELRFEVRDDGPGFDPLAPTDGVGLRNMRDRLDALHGRLEITSSPGGGVVVAGAVPVA